MYFIKVTIKIIEKSWIMHLKNLHSENFHSIEIKRDKIKKGEGKNRHKGRFTSTHPDLLFPKMTMNKFA